MKCLNKGYVTEQMFRGAGGGQYWRDECILLFYKKVNNYELIKPRGI